MEEATSSEPSPPATVNTADARPNRRPANSNEEEEDVIDPNQYRENRLKYIVANMSEGNEPYPHKFSVSMSFAQFIHTYGGLSKGERVKDVSVSLAGHIKEIRTLGAKLVFYDLCDNDDIKVQIIADERNSNLKRFDIVGVTGFPGKSKSGELSIFAKTITVLSHCLHLMPKQKSAAAAAAKNVNQWVPGSTRNPETYILKDQETRYRSRHLDLMLHPEIREIFKTRCKIVKYIRKYLDDRDFLEVETPTMNMIPGGAVARPFETHHNELDMKLFMRIAPELYLKQLVIGKMGRVYEIGKQYRNEGMDLTHNPEFTTCEFYMPFADYYELMEITEEMLNGMVHQLTNGSYKIKYHANGVDKDPIEIDFTPPFRRIDMIEELESKAGLSIPKDLASEEANEYLKNACLKYDIKCAPPQTTARLLDKLVGHFLEEMCVNPTFIMNHPEIMSPLAKSHRAKPGLTERFELFVNKHELCNAYSELNNPVVQRERFAQQHKDKKSGDDEAMPFDEHYCSSLEYGMPPTGGWGLGIDRLTMLLTDSQNIKEVILFPAMKPQDVPSPKGL